MQPTPSRSSFPSLKLAGRKRNSLSGNGGLLNRMFGSSTSVESNTSSTTSTSSTSSPFKESSDELKPQTHSSNSTIPNDTKTPESAATKARRSSSVSKAKDIFASARSSFTFSKDADKSASSAMQKLSKADPALGVPQGSLNNSAGESSPGPHSTFKVGVTEDRNRKCRRTMEDTHAYLYNFLSTPRADPLDANSTSEKQLQVTETDNGYFAIFDGHAGTFAADWCGKKLHLLLEETIRKNPNTPIPELLDSTFTLVDQQLEKLPVKNSGCTAVTAVLRWEDRVPNTSSATGSVYISLAAAKANSVNSESDADKQPNSQEKTPDPKALAASEVKLRPTASRQRVLYTANVGDARIVLCRNGRALRLSYDHKGSDESEGRRIANAGGLILNNRVNGVLAVTRALGDSYMKDLVTGHPYTTETVIQPEADEFMILACDGLWDVCSDQEAVDLIRSISDPQVASKALVDHALGRFSTDNLSCMVVRFDSQLVKARKTDATIGVEGDEETKKGGISEADAIVSEQAKKIGGGSSTDGVLEQKDVSFAEDKPMSEEEARKRRGDNTTTVELDPDAPKAAMKKAS